jgi:transmembrane sensor
VLLEKGMIQLPENITPGIIAAYFGNQISSKDVVVLQNWIDSSPENKKYFEQIKAIYKESGKLIPSPVDVDVDLAWKKMSLDIDKYEQKDKAVKNNHPIIILKNKYLLRAAAVIIPIIAITAIYFLYSQKSETVVKSTTVQTLQDTLSDGSMVCLNKQSKLIYPDKFKGTNREVTMNGEIYFEVKPDKEKPFVIHAANTLVTVLGTKFNVKAYSDSADIEVFVESGRVMFSEASQNRVDSITLILEDGEKGIFNKSSHKFSKIQTVDANDVFWKTKTLVFTRAQLSQVISTLKKNYNINIVLKAESLKNLHFSATFKEQPVDSIIEIIVNTFDLKISKEGSKYILYQNGQ